jgi:glycosyltransferase involved in cell wall biosynthesis
MRLDRSDGTIERAGIHVMHLTRQQGFISSVPSIFVPHDLQHLHWPQFFSMQERRERTLAYSTFCRNATAVLAVSRHGKQDLEESLRVPGNKIFVVWHGPAISTSGVPIPEGIATTKQRYGLEGAFAYYPAQTWKHKNHLKLLEALAVLRDKHDLIVPMVFSGHKTEHFAVIERCVRKLHLESQVKFLGHVAPADLQALYLLSRMVIFPSLFEGFGMPLIEAFSLGVPVASSRATSLPEIAGEAALLFDAESPAGIAQALQTLWSDQGLRDRLIQAGLARSRQFSWEASARRTRALYRLVGGRTLSKEDGVLLDQMV